MRSFIFSESPPPSPQDRLGGLEGERGGGGGFEKSFLEMKTSALVKMQQNLNFQICIPNNTEKVKPRVPLNMDENCDV